MKSRVDGIVLLLLVVAIAGPWGCIDTSPFLDHKGKPRSKPVRRWIAATALMALCACEGASPPVTVDLRSQGVYTLTACARAEGIDTVYSAMYALPCPMRIAHEELFVDSATMSLAADHSVTMIDWLRLVTNPCAFGEPPCPTTFQWSDTMVSKYEFSESYMQLPLSDEDFAYEQYRDSILLFETKPRTPVHDPALANQIWQGPDTLVFVARLFQRARHYYVRRP